MNTIKSLVRFLLIGFELILLFGYGYFIIAVVGNHVPTGKLESAGERYIYVQSNGVHTDVTLPVSDTNMNWLSFIPHKDFPTASDFEFITFGWGDKGFYLDTPNWSDLKISTALYAACLPSPTAMHVSYSSEPETTTFRKKVFIDQEGYIKLIAYIKKSFQLKNNSVQLIKHKSYTYNDNFYEANHSYHLFRTCNRWTNSALKTAGVKTGIFALFPKGIMKHL